jgi:hypothetical protein
MGKNKPVVPANKENPKRTAAKLKRGFGQGMIKKLGISEVEWCQRFDPLFKVKGKERRK